MTGTHTKVKCAYFFPFYKKLIIIQNSAAHRHSFAHNQWAIFIQKILGLYNWKQFVLSFLFLSCFQLYKAEIFETRFAHWLCANECLRAAEFCILISFWKKGKWERKKNFFRLVWKADWFCSLKPDPSINTFCVSNFTIELLECSILEKKCVFQNKTIEKFDM